MVVSSSAAHPMGFAGGGKHADYGKKPNLDQ
jgi:hypothetical protein